MAKSYSTLSKPTESNGALDTFITKNNIQTGNYIMVQTTDNWPSMPLYSKIYAGAASFENEKNDLFIDGHSSVPNQPSCLMENNASVYQDNHMTLQNLEVNFPTGINSEFSDPYDSVTTENYLCINSYCIENSGGIYTFVAQCKNQNPESTDYKLIVLMPIFDQANIYDWTDIDYITV